MPTHPSTSWRNGCSPHSLLAGKGRFGVGGEALCKQNPLTFCLPPTQKRDSLFCSRQFLQIKDLLVTPAKEHAWPYCWSWLLRAGWQGTALWIWVSPYGGAGHWWHEQLRRPRRLVQAASPRLLSPSPPGPLASAKSHSRREWGLSVGAVRVDLLYCLLWAFMFGLGQGRGWLSSWMIELLTNL